MTSIGNEQMVRKKVKLQLIENDSARKVTFRKRVKGIQKKAEELSVLCGVDVCVVIYGQYNKEPVTWPSDQAEARRILLEFKHRANNCSHKKLDQESYLKESIGKAEDKMLKMQRKNREFQMENHVVELLCGKPVEFVPFFDLPDLIWVICEKMRAVQNRITKLGIQNNILANAMAYAPAGAIPVNAMASAPAGAFPVDDMAIAHAGAIPNLNLVDPNAQVGEEVPLEMKLSRSQ